MAKRILDGSCSRHGIVGTTRAAASTFPVEAPNRNRASYLPQPDETVAQFRKIVDTDFIDLHWQEPNLTGTTKGAP
jgi:hypothetical protein